MRLHGPHVPSGSPALSKNGYYPTDEPHARKTSQRTDAQRRADASSIPALGGRLAIAEAAHALGREAGQAFAVECPTREWHPRSACLVDHCLHAGPDGHDGLQAVVRLLWLNRRMATCPRIVERQHRLSGQVVPPPRKSCSISVRLSLLQYGGVLVFIVPAYVLDAELVGWLTRHYSGPAHLPSGGDAVQAGGDLRPNGRDSVNRSRWRQGRAQSAAAGWASEVEAEELPSDWPFLPYIVPASPAERAFLPRDDGAGAVRR